MNCWIIITADLNQHTLLGMDDCSLDNVNEDNAETENITNINIGINDIDDNGTLALEEPFFPLPKGEEYVNEAVEDPMVNAGGEAGIVINDNNVFLPIYAPLSMFQFHRPFTNEEFFMVKLCYICDKANVPHHIVDDIVDLLRDCKRNNIVVLPEQLLKRVHFLKHLEN